MLELYRAHSTNRPSFEDLVRKVFPDEVTRSLIMLAYRLAKAGHSGQMREGGERYFEHPKSMALMLLVLMLLRIGKPDADVIVAALLHDMGEDSFLLTFWAIRHIFGDRVHHLVWMMTKRKDLPTAEYFLALLLDEDPGSAIEKCADRVHNMSTLVNAKWWAVWNRKHFLNKKKRQIAETREYVIPLADKLANMPGYEQIGQWFVFQLTSWCDIREQEVAKAEAWLVPALRSVFRLAA
jgi:(p)ppGpp synthase/HD superfamily hydrolase